MSKADISEKATSIKHLKSKHSNTPQQSGLRLTLFLRWKKASIFFLKKMSKLPKQKAVDHNILKPKLT